MKSLSDKNSIMKCFIKGILLSHYVVIGISLIFSRVAIGVEVPPVVGEWSYDYANCNDFSQRLGDEQVAILEASNKYYNKCGDVTVVRAKWGTSESRQRGVCGSSKLYPRPNSDYIQNVEARNAKNVYVTSCMNEDDPDGKLDSFTLYRYRNITCPAGGCSADVSPVKDLDNTCAGNPISFSTGNKFQIVIDHAVDASGGLMLKRRYDSVIGKWQFDFEAKLITTKGNKLYVYRPNNEQYIFRLDGGVWKSDDDIMDTVEKLTVDGVHAGWRYSSMDNTIEDYNVYGALTKRTLRNGRVLTYSYSLMGKLESISNDRSQSYTLSYQNSGALDRVTASGGEAYVYKYDALKNLETVSLEINETPSVVARYHYENESFPNALTGMTDDQGVRFSTWAYDDKGRAYSSEHAGAREKVIIDYAHLDDVIDPRVTLTNPKDKRTSYHFEIIHGVRKVKRVEGHVSDNCAAANKGYDYFPNGTLKSKTDWAGNTTSYIRDDLGRETTRTEGEGSEEESVVMTEYHSTLNLPEKITTENDVTNITYNDKGRVLTRTVTPTTPQPTE